MGYLCCNAESAIATCDPYNKPAATIIHFSYSQLESATDHFSPSNFLGKGSHGTVFKANLTTLVVAAVKKTTTTIPIPKTLPTPAQNEIHILSKLPNHRHLVNLVGFSTGHSQLLLIVVEFMPNGSLFHLLHSTPTPPGWTRRLRLALHVAKALRFLHTSDPPVIHRDIKSSNVLLDSNGRARLGDFGLAVRGHVEDVPPAGTLGYLDPTYLAPAHLTTKTDVYSFGVLLLEIITGRNAIDLSCSPPSLVDWATPIIKRGEFDRICDRRIGPPDDFSVISQLALLAAKCVRAVAGKRPAMTEIVESLRIMDKQVRSPIWNNFGRRMRCVTKSGSAASESSKDDRLKEEEEEEEGEEETKSSSSSIKICKLGSRRRNKKVSGECDPMKRERLGRSKSKPGLDDGNSGETMRVRRKHDEAVKLPVVRLSKSRSMGMAHTREKGGVALVLKKKNPQIEECCKLLVSLDH